MTDEEIRNMPAGREIDKLVAQGVMGLSTVHPPDTIDYCARCEHMRSVSDYCGLRYSTEIAAAWEVVEKMRPNYTALEIASFTPPKWAISLSGAVIYVEADTAPLAISRAALLAVNRG